MAAVVALVQPKRKRPPVKVGQMELGPTRLLQLAAQVRMAPEVAEEEGSQHEARVMVVTQRRAAGFPQVAAEA